MKSSDKQLITQKAYFYVRWNVLEKYYNELFVCNVIITVENLDSFMFL